MQGFRAWLLGEDAKLVGHIKVPLPSVRQSHNFDCGAAALRAVCEFYGVGPETEAEFIKALKTTKKDGTHPKNIIRAAQAFGLLVDERRRMTVEELAKVLDRRRPVICAIQAWGEPDQYVRRQSGHYVIAIGYDGENIYFEDPSMKGNRGKLTYQEFDQRWHDRETDGTLLDHYGIVLWRRGGRREGQRLTTADRIE